MKNLKGKIATETKKLSIFKPIKAIPVSMHSVLNVKNYWKF